MIAVLLVCLFLFIQIYTLGTISLNNPNSGMYNRNSDKTSSIVSINSVSPDSSTRYDLNDHRDTSHLLFHGFREIYEECNEDKSNFMVKNSATIVSEAMVYEIPALFSQHGIISSELPYRANLCLAKHTHFHTIDLQFKDINTKSEQCIAFLSTTASIPDIQHWDWRVLGKPLKIHTYSEEFLSRDGIFISIYKGKEKVSQDCTLEVMISEVPYNDIVKKSNLRGNGQVVLPKS